MQMNIGRYTIIKTRKYNDTVLWRAVQQGVREYLGEPEGRRLIARAARSEAKDFIQDQYEGRDLPFEIHCRSHGPEGCTHGDDTYGDGHTRCAVCNPELIGVSRSAWADGKYADERGRPIRQDGSVIEYPVVTERNAQ